MEGILSYGSSSSSSSADSGESTLDNKKLKHMVACEESEVASSVVHDEPSGLIVESSGDPTTTLLEMGCTPEQVVQAIGIWGRGTPVEDLFDFIQAITSPVGEESIVLKTPVRQEDAQMQSREACSLQGHITNSRVGFTEENNSVLEVPGYIYAPCYNKEASCSRSHHVGGSDQDEDENAITLQKLERMGFTQDLVQRASEDCTSIDFDVLLEHLLGTRKEDLHLQNQTQPEVGSSGPECQERSRSATPLQRLEIMGYSPTIVQRASEECNSIDFDVLLEYLMEAEEDDLQNQEHSEVDSSEDEDGEVTPVMRLQKMGFPFSSIKKAMEISGNQDLKGLLDVLYGSEYMKNKGDIDAGEGRQPLAHVSDLQEKNACASLPKRKFSSGGDVGSSRCQWGEVKWTRDTEKLWCSYIGGKKKSDPLLMSESEDSENDILGSAWEDESLKPSPKPRRGKRKIDFLEPKKVNKVGPRQGKMMGFGIPSLIIGRPNPVPCHMQGPPYFYYENVAGVPNNEWDTIKRHFNGVDPEFTDSKFFSATKRPRGYVHNLPIENRRQLLCTPPMTIYEALPDTQKNWPSWDTREKLNCINTRKAPDSLCGMIRKIFRMYEGVDIPHYRQQEIVQACKKWNLVWVGPGITAPLDPPEIELLLGFEKDHTRGCSSITERYEALGNSFQVNTVAYHLSPLKFLYPDGITVLSLFSGIGGAEVALHKLGIRLKIVIAVEINEKLRGVLASWWKRSKQMGELKLRVDVRDLTNDALADLIDEVGRIDLIIGGSPCNNLSGNNRISRVGLCGIDSSLFFEFTRILTFIRQAMRDRGFV